MDPSKVIDSSGMTVKLVIFLWVGGLVENLYIRCCTFCRVNAAES